MLKISALLMTFVFCSIAIGGPILQMNKAFFALTELIPFITDRDKFMEKKNENIISTKIADLQTAFKTAKHDTLLKEDLFAPSYALINDHITDSFQAFKKGDKDYAHWRLKETTSLCLDCHTRMPPSHPSSFQNGDLTIDKSKFENSYNLGIAQLIVRRYVDAKESFIRNIDEKLIKKEPNDLMLSFKQVLLIDTKVLKNPDNLGKFLNEYSSKKDLPEDVKARIAAWNKGLKHWKGSKFLKEKLTSDQEVEKLINDELAPLKKKITYIDGHDVDLLLSSGLLSNYLFENPQSKMAPEIIYWIGWSEKYLKRENFFSSGDLFLKQCIKRYPKSAIARKCLEEYRDSVEFEFSGSSGTNIPQDIKKELNDLESQIKKK